jgi:hypothetical protein
VTFAKIRPCLLHIILSVYASYIVRLSELETGEVSSICMNENISRIHKSTHNCHFKTRRTSTAALRSIFSGSNLKGNHVNKIALLPHISPLLHSHYNYIIDLKLLLLLHSVYCVEIFYAWLVRCRQGSSLGPPPSSQKQSSLFSDRPQ